MTTQYISKCANCGQPLKKEKHYVIGSHVYACSEKCRKELFQLLMDTFYPPN